MTPKQWVKIHKYLMKKLGDFGCPDSKIQSTARNMTNDIKDIMETSK